jgi:hypothetical protein
MAILLPRIIYLQNPYRYRMYIKENILELGTGQEMASKEGSLLFISLDFQCGRWGGGGSGLIFLCTVQTSVPETEMEFLNTIFCRGFWA